VAGPAWRVVFLQSCAAVGELPVDARPEAAFLGRSNVGKSSLLNALAGQAHLAHAGATPGRTRLLNLFDAHFGAAGHVRLVDCPGYGYARAGKRERERWSGMVESYLARRANLRLAVLLVDANIPPQALDLEACAWLRARAIPLQLVATKCDRLSGNQRAQALRRLAEAMGAAPLPFSAVTPLGRAELRRAIAAAAATAIPPTAGR
jgi:GTP-binding protein